MLALSSGSPEENEQNRWSIYVVLTDSIHPTKQAMICVCGHSHYQTLPWSNSSASRVAQWSVSVPLAHSEPQTRWRLIRHGALDKVSAYSYWEIISQNRPHHRSLSGRARLEYFLISLGRPWQSKTTVYNRTIRIGVRRRRDPHPSSHYVGLGVPLQIQSRTSDFIGSPGMNGRIN